MMSERRNCPKCGSALTHIEETDRRIVYRVSCSVCSYSPDWWSRTEGEAVEYWNTRPIEDALRSELEHVESCFLEFETITDNGLFARVSDVVKALADARSELDKLREQVRWRKYPDEKPDDSSDKLVYTCFRERLVGYLDRGQWSVQGVTYWMPLPQPQEEA